MPFKTCVPVSRPAVSRNLQLPRTGIAARSPLPAPRSFLTDPPRLRVAFVSDLALRIASENSPATKPTLLPFRTGRSCGLPARPGSPAIRRGPNCKPPSEATLLSMLAADFGAPRFFPDRSRKLAHARLRCHDPVPVRRLAAHSACRGPAGAPAFRFRISAKASGSRLTAASFPMPAFAAMATSLARVRRCHLSFPAEAGLLLRRSCRHRLDAAPGAWFPSLPAATACAIAAVCEFLPTAWT